MRSTWKKYVIKIQRCEWDAFRAWTKKSGWEDECTKKRITWIEKERANQRGCKKKCATSTRRALAEKRWAPSEQTMTNWKN